MVLAVFWLSGSAAWASGVSAVKFVSDPDSWLKTLKICNENAGCASLFAGNFAGLNISIVSHLMGSYNHSLSHIKFPFQIFGFLNFFLWAVNLWFLYKETSWFQDSAAAAAGSPMPN